MFCIVHKYQYFGKFILLGKIGRAAKKNFGSSIESFHFVVLSTNVIHGFKIKENLPNINLSLQPNCYQFVDNRSFVQFSQTN